VRDSEFIHLKTSADSQSVDFVSHPSTCLNERLDILWVGLIEVVCDLVVRAPADIPATQMPLLPNPGGLYSTLEGIAG
jgi:hypothetical protein